MIRQLMEGRHVQESFRALFESYYPAVRSYFARRGFSPEDCRDLAQDVFVAVHTGISTLHAEEAFTAWLFSIARHVAARHLERARNPVRSASAASGDPQFDAPSPEPSPLGAMLDQEKVEVMRAALEELPDRMRQCVRARLVDELSYREIGERLGISENTVAVHVHRAMKTMRARLRAFFGDEPLREDL
ncbi:MAG TPA: sigma-70 family RNA polymerase sigma factor [Candidatus Sulfopaludibacter sp.]|nr:sigma-70 family RNA polymerase sigma factor [Candidatus Sulfopaludibacter sp.]